MNNVKPHPECGTFHTVPQTHLELWTCAQQRMGLLDTESNVPHWYGAIQNFRQGVNMVGRFMVPPYEAQPNVQTEDPGRNLQT